MDPAPQGDERRIRADRQGVIRHWGRVAQDVFGYTPQEAIGRRVDLIIPPALRYWHWRGFAKAMENGRLRRSDPNLKVPAVHRDGAIIPLRAILELTHADDGRADGAQVTVVGRGPAWRATAWRIVLAPLNLFGPKARQPPGECG